jgi:hypothetical protein
MMAAEGYIELKAARNGEGYSNVPRLPRCEDFAQAQI